MRIHQTVAYLRILNGFARLDSDRLCCVSWNKANAFSVSKQAM